MAAMKLLPAHKNFSLSHLPDGGIVPWPKVEVNFTVVFIMPGIICSNCKAWKSGKPLTKITKLTDLNQTVDCKWVTAAPVCHLYLITL